MYNFKEVYNTYLKVIAKHSNRPYKFKINFDGFEQSENFIYSNKVSNFLNRNISVNIEDFFEAPYFVYSDEKYFSLDFYTTQKAVKCYGMYMSQKDTEDPDTTFNLTKINEGLKFIKKFCIDNNLTLEEYLNYRTGKINEFVIHLKNRKISVYNLFSFNNFDLVFLKLDYSILQFILNGTLAKIPIYRAKFYSSIQAKQLSKKGLEIVEKAIKKTLKK